MTHQRTIKAVTRSTGVGVHSGKRVDMTLRPAPADTGIVFRRLDLEPVVDIKASAMAVGDTRLASTLVNGGAKVSTVEHLLSACAGLGIDNLYVDLTAEEVPIMDGSAATFVFLLQSAGIEEQRAPRKYLEVLKVVEVREAEGKNEKWARIEPHFGFKLKVSIDFNHPGIDATGKEVSFDFAQNPYVREVARARTFGFAKDVEMLRAKGLARGGTMDNAIVVDDFRVLNADGLRYDDEFARHKLLDAVGDLYVAGMPLLGSFVAHRTGHAMNNMLLRTLLAQEDAYRVVTFDAPGQIAPKMLLSPDYALA